MPFCVKARERERERVEGGRGREVERKEGRERKCAHERVCVGSDSENLLELELNLSKDRGLLSYNIDSFFV